MRKKIRPYRSETRRVCVAFCRASLSSRRSLLAKADAKTVWSVAGSAVVGERRPYMGCGRSRVKVTPCSLP